MKGSFFDERVGLFKTMVVLLGLFLVSCGSGGGGGLVLPDNPSGCDSNPVTGQLTNGQSIKSKDGKATFTVTSATFLIGVGLAVDCSTGPTGQIGKAYRLEFTGDQGQNTVLEISYAGVDLGDISETALQLGVYDPDGQSWVAEQAAVPNINTDTFTLSNPLPDRYAIFSQSTGGGGGGDTTAPSQPTGVGLSVSSGTIRIQWNASQDNPGGTGVKGYDVFRGFDEFSISTQLNPSPPGSITQTFYNDSPPVVGTTRYCYAVRAVDNAGNTSGLSTPVCNPS